MYLFGFFHLNFLLCDDRLVKTVVNGIIVKHPSSISQFRLYNSVYLIQDYALNTLVNNYKFNIFKYLQLNGGRFPRNYAYDHYHLNLYLDNMYNVYYGFQFIHNPHLLNLLPSEFKIFNLTDLWGKSQQ